MYCLTSTDYLTSLSKASVALRLQKDHDKKIAIYYYWNSEKQFQSYIISSLIFREFLLTKLTIFSIGVLKTWL